MGEQSHAQNLTKDKSINNYTTMESMDNGVLIATITKKQSLFSNCELLHLQLSVDITILTAPISHSILSKTQSTLV